MASSGNPTGEPMYSAAQIRIPPDLPEVLKSFTKAAIKTQPSNLTVWAAQYFEALANGDAPPVKDRVAIEPTVIREAPALTVAKLRKLFSTLPASGTVPVADLVRLCEEQNLPGQTVQDSLCVGDFGEQVPIIPFLALQAAVLKPALADALYTFGSILGDDDSGTAVPREPFLEAIRFMCNISGAPADQMALVVDQCAEGQSVNLLQLDLSSLVDDDEKANVGLQIEGRHIDNETARGPDDEAMLVNENASAAEDDDETEP
ncbi:uncharacterized protein MONBRDRAFT_38771, partial [Monosiga brevicollis MX1]